MEREKGTEKKWTQFKEVRNEKKEFEKGFSWIDRCREEMEGEIERVLLGNFLSFNRGR